jgi:hypothetical protein
MTPHQVQPEPFIDTTSTRQLVVHVDDLCMRNQHIRDTIAAIRAGDDEALLALVRLAQRGNSDDALVAICSLLPRLCKVVLSRTPIRAWKTSIDDYIPIAFLVILDVGDTEGEKHLSDKIIARTRRRHERQVFAHQPIPFWDEFLIDTGPIADDIEDQALARVELANIGRTVVRGVISPAEWQIIVDTQLRRLPGITTTDRERRAVSRVRQRLTRWSVDTQAA